MWETVYCVLCPVYCVLCPVYCVLCTVYCVLCTVCLCTCAVIFLNGLKSRFSLHNPSYFHGDDPLRVPPRARIPRGLLVPSRRRRPPTCVPPLLQLLGDGVAPYSRISPITIRGAVTGAHGRTAPRRGAPRADRRLVALEPVRVGTPRVRRPALALGLALPHVPAPSGQRHSP